MRVNLMSDEKITDQKVRVYMKENEVKHRFRLLIKPICQNVAEGVLIPVQSVLNQKKSVTGKLEEILFNPIGNPSSDHF